MSVQVRFTRFAVIIGFRMLKVGRSAKISLGRSCRRRGKPPCLKNKDSEEEMTFKRALKLERTSILNEAIRKGLVRRMLRFVYLCPSLYSPSSSFLVKPK